VGCTQRLPNKEWGHENLAELEGLAIIVCVTSLNALFEAVINSDN
jgi:hypothetical protein